MNPDPIGGSCEHTATTSSCNCPSSAVRSTKALSTDVRAVPFLFRTYRSLAISQHSIPLRVWHESKLTDQIRHSHSFQLEHDRTQLFTFQPLDPARHDVVADRMTSEFSYLADKVSLPDGREDDFGRVEEDGLQEVGTGRVSQEGGQEVV